jgi:D-arabinose 1-dehydrogenase-like Zn-dependent alcohol dehydrogenase
MSVRAAVMPGPNEPLRIVDFPLPVLEPGAALLRTLYSEVCGTDVHLHHGKLSVPFPIIPGHVSVGVVEATGGKLKDIGGNPIKEGDVVTFLDVHETCNNCYHCRVSRRDVHHARSTGSATAPTRVFWEDGRRRSG